MTRVNGFNGDIPPRDSSKVSTGSSGSSYVSSFDEYKAKQQAEYAQYQEQRKNDYEAFVQQRKAEVESFKKKGADDNQGTKPADVSKANAEYAEAMRNPDNWVEVKAQPAQQPLVTNGTAPSAQKSTGDAPKLTDYISGLSKETVEYLNNSEQFKGFEQEYTKLITFQLMNEQAIPDKKQALLAAKEKFNNTPYSDFDAKKAAQDEMYAAQKAYDEVRGDAYIAGEKAEEKMKAILSYVDMVNDWKDGTVIISSRQTVGTGKSNVYNKEYTMVTLPNGQKAYESDGKFYQLNPEGYPDHDRLIE